MDTSAIASLATGMSNARVQQAVEISVLKKAIDIEAEGALQLLQAMPPLPTLSSTGGTAGELVNITA
jgi:Putative motility protein